MENRKDWKRQVGYGRRWSVEITFSTFKRMFGGCMHAKKSANIRQEIFFKVKIYN